MYLNQCDMYGLGLCYVESPVTRAKGMYKTSGLLLLVSKCLHSAVRTVHVFNPHNALCEGATVAR